MDSNRLRVALIRESTLGTLPGTPRMRTARITGESLKYVPKFFTPGEIRSDRMSADPTKINEENSGGLNFEFSFPADNTFLSELIQSGFFSLWSNTPFRDNDGTAASAITSVTVTTNVVVVTSGTAFAIGHLVRNTGFGLAANNGVFRVTTGGATSFTCTGAGFATEASPAAAARSKVVGFQGVAADITATATGLGATTLNFTTLGLVVGQWIKIGGTAAGNKFATSANNDWVRITAITATALTCDNLPSGWTTDAGTGKTISVFFGDYIRNSTTMISMSIERGHLDQATPTYLLQKGMVVDQFSQALATEQPITGSVNLTGMSGIIGTVANGSSYDAATTNQVMTANVSVGRIAEAGATIVSPNWAKALNFQIANNIRMITAIGTVGAATLGAGEFSCTGTLETYFGSSALLAKLMAGTVSNLSARAALNSQAVIWTFPRVTFTDGSPNAGGKNQDVTLPLTFTTSIDTVTNCEAQADRFEYFEV